MCLNVKKCIYDKGVLYIILTLSGTHLCCQHLHRKYMFQILESYRLKFCFIHSMCSCPYIFILPNLKKPCTGTKLATYHYWKTESQNFEKLQISCS